MNRSSRNYWQRGGNSTLRQRVESQAKIAFENARRKRRAAADHVEKTLQALEQGQLLLGFGRDDGEPAAAVR